MEPQRSRPLAKLGLLVASLLLALVVAEMLLQLGALVAGAVSREAPAGFLTANRRIVCVGDSNTYGLYVERDETYPGRLEQQWNDAGRGASIEVLNLGYPGTNSSVVAREFPRILEDLSPSGVIVLVGANDFWTARVQEEAGEGPLQRAAGWLRRSSRLYRIVAMLGERRAPGKIEATPFTPDPTVPRRVGTVRYGDHAFTLGFEGRKEWGEADEIALVQNLERLVGMAEEASTSLVLLTYPSSRDLYGFANQLIRRAAGSTGAALVDLGTVFAERCPDPACDELLFADDHPTPLGYALIAETIVERAPHVLGP